MNSYYDTIPNFKYWDVEAWKEYIQNYIVPIYENTKYLLELKDKLYFYVDMSLEMVNQCEKKILPFFVGDIDENGNYKENSLARLIYLMFGIYVEPKEFANTIKELGEEGLKDIKIKSKNKDEWAFIKFLEEMYNYSSEIIEKLKIDIQTSIKIDDIIQNPDKILDILKELYKVCVSFSANYNYYTFFVISSYGIHWKYLVSAYPKLNEHFGEIKEFLGFCPMFVPDVNSDAFKKDYTIWYYEKGSIGDSLFNMQIILWHFFDFFNYEKYYDYYFEYEKYKEGYEKFYEIFKYIVEKPENLKETYKELVKKSLENVFEEINIENAKINLKDVYLFIIDEKYIVKWPKKEIVDRYYHAKNDYRNNKIIYRTKYNYEIPYEEELSKPKILLFDFLNKVAPILFLKLAIILTIENSEYWEITNYGKLPILMYYGDFLRDFPYRLRRLK
ncbi:hypothetical protein [Methanocaldococcus sp.]|uniref:hypothetical protein n=1 Tax=Methanocaldococcus sp. TaxID=2152917 RepID=UPI002610531A|nr:hypothetical protein [Methanocaldococcus sp.]MCQ6254624.1 hypothetical protein [Methanocaldococcus sp.]